MDTAALQSQLFQAIKAKLPAHKSLVDDLAGVLSISTDSAYRRLRSEKTLTLEEVYKLCTHYQLSLDRLLNLNATNAFVFSGQFVDPTNFKFDEYLMNVGQQVKYMNSFKERKMYYLCKDIPIFYHFHYRELAAFKHYFWMKAILNHPDFKNKKFSLAGYPDHLFELGKQSLLYYNNIESVEIWNIETIISTMRQIDYYYNFQLFENEAEVLLIYEALEKLFLHLELQADVGYKFEPGDAAKKPLAPIQMYYNEVILGDNSILAVLDGSKMAFMIHNVINFMITRDVTYCDKTYENIINLTQRSTLISEVSEVERSRFFKYLRGRIATRKENLKA